MADYDDLYVDKFRQWLLPDIATDEEFQTPKDIHSSLF